MKRVVRILFIFLLLFFVGVKKVSALTIEEDTTLENDITDGIYIPEGKSVTLNLNGHSITGRINKSNYTGTIINEGTLIIEGDGEIKCTSHQAVINKKNLIINGGTFKTQKQDYNILSEGESLIINNGNFDKGIILKLSGNDKIKKFEINGGNFNSKESKIYLDNSSKEKNIYRDVIIKNINISELILGGFDANVSSVENITIENTNITGNNNNSFIYNGSGNIFIKNIESGNALITGNPKRINIENGIFKTLGLSGNSNSTNTTLINLIVTSQLYIENPNNNATIKCGYYEEVSSYKQAVSEHLGGNILIEDGKINKLNGYGEGKINIKGGTITGTIISDNSSTITIENGIFKGILISKNTPVNKKANGNGTFEIRGGVFDIEPINEFVNSEYIKETNLENRIIVTKESEIYNNISSSIIDATTIDERDIELIKNRAKNKYNIVSYYNVLNSEMTGNKELINYVKETAEYKKVTINLPDNLPNIEEGSKRNYVILVLNDKEVDIIDNIQINYNEIEFKTNKFTTYALGYYDTNNDSQNVAKRIKQPANNKRKYSKIVGLLNRKITLPKNNILKPL